VEPAPRPGTERPGKSEHAAHCFCPGALSAGWGRPDELKEPDVDALRERNDFQKLLAELEAKTAPKAKPRD
jgi:hypothetical protein